MPIVDFEVALLASGLRLVLLAGAPSPWSQAALALFRHKRLAFECARASTVDPAFLRWNAAKNLPAVLFRDEPVRTGWAEILDLAEQLAPEPPLLPSEAAARARVLGLCHELMSEGGLLWSARLLAIDAGLSSDGREGFPLRAARYLAPRYGWTPGCNTAAHEQAILALGLLETELAREPGPFYCGDTLSAVDLYSAAALNLLVPLPQTDCPLAPAWRAAFTWMGSALGTAITSRLLVHRDYVVSRFFDVSIEF